MKHVLPLLSIFLSFQVCAQTYLNTTWERYTDKPDTLAWSASATLGAAVVSIGNTFNASSSTDISITVTNDLGNEIWTATYDGGQNSEDYAVDLIADESNNIFVTGAGRVYNDSTFDIVVLKYNIAGTLQWSASYTASDSLNEYPISIGLDDDGNVYVAGSDEDSVGIHDYLLVKWNSSGTFQWAATYDYNGNDDIAGAMAFSKNHITITGGSEDSDSTWDITTVQYDYSGNLDGTPNRQTAADARLDYPKDLVKDENDYYYIAGTAYDTTGKLRGKIIALDDTLGLAWVAYCDSVGESRFNSLTLCNNELYVTGSYINDNDIPHTLTEKYATDGICQWSEIYFDEEGMSGDGIKVRVEASDVHIASTLAGPTIYNMLYVKYDTAGTFTSDRKFTGIQADIAVATDLDIVDSNTVILSGIVEDANGTQHYRAQYDILEINKGEVTDTTNGDHIEGTLLVSFNPDIVTPNFQDTETQQWEQLSQIIPDSTYNSITAFLDLPGDYEIMCVKGFPDFLSSDTLSVGYEGDTFRTPPFWAVYELFVPDTTDLFLASDTIETLWPDVSYAEPIFIGTRSGIPNDPYYSNTTGFQQQALKNGTYLLNAEDAWNKETGNSNIRIGIIDDGFGQAFSSHNTELWEFTTQSSAISSYPRLNNYKEWHLIQSRINVHPVPANYSSADHGTMVTSIILANRDNGLGIAGIAGGDSPSGNNSDGIKATIYDSDRSSSKELARGINYFTKRVVNSLDKQCQFVLYASTQSRSSNAVNDALDYSRHVGITFIQSHANNDKQENVYPASLFDEWALLVGASDRSGHKLGMSSYGGQIDVVAPSDRFSLTGKLAKGSDYDYAIGASFSSAAVAGGVGLLYSYIGGGFNLTHEDVENIVQRSANPDAGPINSFWDVQTGDGSVNINAMLIYVDPASVKLLHRSTLQIPTLISPIYTSRVIEVLHGTSVIKVNGGNLAAGKYTADIYEIQYTIDHNIPSGYSKDVVWVRHSASSFYGEPGHSGNPNGVLPYSFVEIVSSNANATTVKGYVYKITHKNGSTLPAPVWFPNPNDQLRMAITVRATKDPTSVNEIAFMNDLKIYPNPISNLNSDINIQLPQENNYSNPSLEVYNVTGTLIFAESNVQVGSNGVININIGNLSAGYYTITVKTNELVYSGKLIVHE